MEVVHDKLILRIFVVVADSSQIPSTILSFSTSSQTVSEAACLLIRMSFSQSSPIAEVLEYDCRDLPWLLDLTACL